MNHPIVHSSDPILLVGGGEINNRQLGGLLDMVKIVVGVDGGADALHRLGALADVVIGDLDSIGADARAALPADRVHHIAEQDSTDFDKALRNVAAPLILGAGFLGARLDHQLAALSVLVRRADKRVVLVGGDDVVLVAPPVLSLDLPMASRVSLFPLRRVTGRSEGLRWPIDGLDFTPDGRIGTSNAVSGPVRLWFDQPGMILMLPQTGLAAVLAGLADAPDQWPVP